MLSIDKTSGKVELRLEGNYPDIMVEATLLMKEVIKLSVQQGGFPTFEDALTRFNEGLLKVKDLKDTCGECEEKMKNLNPEEGAKMLAEIEAKVAKTKKLIELSKELMGDDDDDEGTVDKLAEHLAIGEKMLEVLRANLKENADGKK